MRTSQVTMFVALAMMSLVTSPSPPPAISNLDFEKGPPGQVPDGWSAANALRRGFMVAIVEKWPHGGRRCLEIRRDGSGMQWSEFGALMRTIDATPWRGRRFRLAGWLRFTGPDAASAGLWVRVSRSRDRAAAVRSDPVVSSEWSLSSAVGEVPADADSISVGPGLQGYGSMWADDLSWEVLGLVGQGDEPPRALDERGERNLVAFARLLGYVRYFHPSDEAAATDWNSFAIAGVDRVEGARSPAELTARLESLFRPIAPTLRIATRPLPPLTPGGLRRLVQRPTRTTRWRYHGWAEGSAPGIYYRRRIEGPIEAPADSILPAGSETNVDLGGGVWCSVPLTLYADEDGTLPRGRPAPTLPRRSAGWIPSGGDRGTRLADVMLFWNAAQHFYPYFDVVGTDWPAQLPAALRRAATDADGTAFERTLQSLVSRLHDGHGSVTSPYSDHVGLSIAWRFVGPRLVVLRADSSIADRVHRGDEVLAIQGRSVADWVREAEAIKSAATPQWLATRVSDALQVLPGVDPVELELRSPAGITRRVSVPRRINFWPRPARPDSVAELRRGVMYVDLDRVTDADFERALPRLAGAQGVIFDLRGYPRRISTVVLAHLVDSTITSARWNIPVVMRPDRRGMTFSSSSWPLTPAAPRLRGRVAFLIDGNAISYAETYLGMVEHYRLAELVGEPTAGTNGTIAVDHLPGGYQVVFTGMKVLKHDGSRHHGVGILPTVPVSPTLAGIAAGRDEQLEKAIEVVSR